MEQFKTVLTSTLPHELAVIKGRLESEGIPCFLKDEYTIQAHHFYSNALGGVKLQVRESDVDRAIEILKETGYYKEEHSKAKATFPELDRITNKIPLLNKFSPGIRQILVIAILILLFILFTYFFVLI